MRSTQLKQQWMNCRITNDKQSNKQWNKHENEKLIINNSNKTSTIVL